MYTDDKCLKLDYWLRGDGSKLSVYVSGPGDSIFFTWRQSDDDYEDGMGWSSVRLNINKGWPWFKVSLDAYVADGGKVGVDDVTLSDGSCEGQEIEFERCLSMPYNFTTYPNLLGWEKDPALSIAPGSFQAFDPIADCHPDLQFFLCSVIFPECTPTGTRLPCRSFCENVTAACTARANAIGLRWGPDACFTFPEADDPQGCVAPEAGMYLSLNGVSSKPTSPTMYTDDKCLKLDYWLRGDGSKLSVYVSGPGDSIFFTWRQSDDDYEDGMGWSSVRLNINKGWPWFKVSLDAYVADGGKVGVDDVTLSDGSCEGQGRLGVVRKVLRSEIALNRPWLQAYLNHSSQEFKELKAEIKENAREAFRNLSDDLLGVSVMSLRQGSVIAELIIATSSNNLDDLADTLQNAVSSGSFGNLTVTNASFTVEQFDFVLEGILYLYDTPWRDAYANVSSPDYEELHNDVHLNVLEEALHLEDASVALVKNFTEENGYVLADLLIFMPNRSVAIQKYSALIAANRTGRFGDLNGTLFHLDDPKNRPVQFLSVSSCYRGDNNYSSYRRSNGRSCYRGGNSSIHFRRSNISSRYRRSNNSSCYRGNNSSSCYRGSNSSSRDRGCNHRSCYRNNSSSPNGRSNSSFRYRGRNSSSPNRESNSSSCYGGSNSSSRYRGRNSSSTNRRSNSSSRYRGRNTAPATENNSSSPNGRSNSSFRYRGRNSSSPNRRSNSSSCYRGSNSSSRYRGNNSSSPNRGSNSSSRYKEVTAPPATEEATAPPATEEATAPLPTDEATVPPLTEEPTAPPATEEATAAPATEEATAPPATEEPTAPPATEEATAAPATEEATAPPATEEVTPPIATEEATAAPATEEATATPATEEATVTVAFATEEATDETSVLPTLQRSTVAPTTAPTADLGRQNRQDFARDLVQVLKDSLGVVRKVLRSEMSLSRPWLRAYLNHSSQEFKDLRAEIKENARQAFRNLIDELLGVSVKSLRQGSVIAELIIATSSNNLDDLAVTLQNAVSSGSFGNLTVTNASFTVEQFDFVLEGIFYLYDTPWRDAYANVSSTDYEKLHNDIHLNVLEEALHLEDASVALVKNFTEENGYVLADLLIFMPNRSVAIQKYSALIAANRTGRFGDLNGTLFHLDDPRPFQFEPCFANMFQFAYGYNGICYVFVNESLGASTNFEDFNNACGRLGGIPVYVTDNVTHHFLVFVIQNDESLTGSAFGVGVQWNAGTAVWEYMDNSDVLIEELWVDTYDPATNPPITDHCAVMSPTGTPIYGWDPAPCEDFDGYICQLACLTDDFTNGYGHNDVCYLFFNESVGSGRNINFEDFENACDDVGAVPVYVSNRTTHEFLAFIIQMAKNSSLNGTAYGVGVRYDPPSQAWEYSDGSEVLIDELWVDSFNPGSRPTQLRFCAAMDPLGNPPYGWNPEVCADLQGYICQKPIPPPVIDCLAGSFVMLENNDDILMDQAAYATAANNITSQLIDLIGDIEGFTDLEVAMLLDEDEEGSENN
uniref:C-type lectin domain-containing protein n=1 Tax=Branchiostoma floridae TaxID=7739 RepID=C3YDV5_BRAFL|eukprot:XP_002605564.1 hypothetical protein BRAFLDRAFT_129542 [Branchiostoma floridae]